MCEFAIAADPLVKKGLFAAAIILSASILGHPPTVLLLRFAGHTARDRSGCWIGFVERALVSLLVLLGLIAQATFIFATKAAVMGLRVPGNDYPKQKKNVEYMLIGTMASFLSALLIGFLGKEIWGVLK